MHLLCFSESMNIFSAIYTSILVLDNTEKYDKYWCKYASSWFHWKYGKYSVGSNVQVCNSGQYENASMYLLGNTGRKVWQIFSFTPALILYNVSTTNYWCSFSFTNLHVDYYDLLKGRWWTQSNKRWRRQSRNTTRATQIGRRQYRWENIFSYLQTAMYVKHK